MKQKIPKIKKNISDFIRSEEGKISKKNALELGIGVAALGFLVAKIVSASHTSYFRSGRSAGRSIGGNSQRSRLSYQFF